jgi:hypothetical protein
MKNILSPIQLLQTEAIRNKTLLKVMTDLLQVHARFIAKLDEYNYLINKKVGPKGNDGHTPTDSELLAIIRPFLQKTLSDEALLRLIQPLIPQTNDSTTPSKEDLLALIKPLIPEVTEVKPLIKGIDYPTEEQIVYLIEQHIKNSQEHEDVISDKVFGNIIKRKKLSTSHIDGLEQTISATFNQLKARGGYLHGGGDTVRAGTGVTIAVDSSGTKVISSTGSGTGYTVETPSGAVDESNRTFTVTHAPVYIVIDGATYFQNAGYTLAGLTLTVTKAPVDFIRSFYI